MQKPVTLSILAALQVVRKLRIELKLGISPMNNINRKQVLVQNLATGNAAAHLIDLTRWKGKYEAMQDGLLFISPTYGVCNDQ